jgi:hypothetical protein
MLSLEFLATGGGHSREGPPDSKFWRSDPSRLFAFLRNTYQFFATLSDNDNCNESDLIWNLESRYAGWSYGLGESCICGRWPLSTRQNPHPRCLPSAPTLLFPQLLVDVVGLRMNFRTLRRLYS